MNIEIECIRDFFVSIGDSCFFRNTKNAYLRSHCRLAPHRQCKFNVGVTHMFDYILNDLHNVKNILETDNIEKIFNKENISQINKSNHLYVKEHCGKFKSIHDINRKSSYHSLAQYNKAIEINFIEKYIRRYYRFINLLTTSEKLLFVYSDENLTLSADNMNIIKEIIKILISKYKLINFKIVNLNCNNMNGNMVYEKIIEHFYVLKYNTKIKYESTFQKLFFEKLIEIYHI